MKNNFYSASTLLRTPKGYLNIFRNKYFMVLLLAVFAAGCKKVLEEDGTMGLCPAVISTTPANNATGVSISAFIAARFNEAINPSTINSTTFTLKQGTMTVAGTITYADSIASFLPTNYLDVNTVYTATITTGVKDPTGNSPLNDYVWSFTTGSSTDLMSPIVSSTDPFNTETGVGINKKVAANFSEAMNPLTISNSTFVLKQGTTVVPGTVTYSGKTAVFLPTTNLTSNTVYTATITTGAQDVAGNRIMSDYVWSFTTGSLSDNIMPTVISTDPVNADMNVELNKKVTASFSEAMNPFTINNITFVLKQGITSISGTVTYSGTTATFSPSVNLLAGTNYTATITTGAEDLSGNS